MSKPDIGARVRCGDGVGKEPKCKVCERKWSEVLTTKRSK